MRIDFVTDDAALQDHALSLMHKKTMDPNGYRRLSHPKNAGENGDVIQKARTYKST